MVQSKKCWCVCGIIAAVIVSLLLLTFIVVYVGIPLVYKKSPDLQRNFVFPTSRLLPKDAEYDNFEKYNIPGATNFYVNVGKHKNVSLGVWYLQPFHLLNFSNIYFDFNASIVCDDHPVVLHFHSNGGNRIKFANMYHILRQIFHVVAFDYRGYGDSSKDELTEDAIIQDSVDLYKWLRLHTKAEIYFWGHSLGAAISTHTIARLSEQNIVPMGLFLEAPFTSMREQIQRNSFYKFFAWLPWYESTMLNPLQTNGFLLNTTHHIQMVECPVMIIHAVDDSITPYSASEKLYNVIRAQPNRDRTSDILYLITGNVTYGHFSLRKVPQLPDYIKAHIDTCKKLGKGKG